MEKYRKKPVVIEAEQWFSIRDAPESNSKIYSRGNNSKFCEKCGELFGIHGLCPTLEGDHIICPGDWIIKGVKGEFYPCKPDIFEMTYDKV